MSAGDIALIVFARAPDVGAVKTRLIPELGVEGARRVYRRLLDRVVACAELADFDSRYLYAADTAGTDYFRSRWSPAARWTVAQQVSGNLGLRMSAAFAEVLSRHAGAVLIGSDLIDLTSADLVSARGLLADREEVVLGPAADGGYWLLGLRRMTPELFVDVPWSSDKVFATTTRRLSALGLRWSELALRHDLDRPADLALLDQEFIEAR